MALFVVLGLLYVISGKYSKNKFTRNSKVIVDQKETSISNTRKCQ